MRRYIRDRTSGATYFFTLTLQHRDERWLVDHVGVLGDVIRAVRSRHAFRMDAMVVLPDHLHAMWTQPPGDGDHSKRWMLIKAAFTRRLVESGASMPHRGTKGERVMWQRRYWEHRVRDDEDFARHVDYIHFNPVKHGYVDRASDWPYSSFQRYVRAGVLPPDWGVSAEGAAALGSKAVLGLRCASPQPTTDSRVLCVAK